ncbi:MAG: HK97 family phage prohead protease [Bacteroidales bacterium]
MKFYINDESVKCSHGFRVLNSGIDFSRFKENPVALLEHDRDKIIGRWNSWTTNGSKLDMDIEFDEGDELALSTKGKVDRGFLKGSSMGIMIKRMEYSTEDDQDLVVTSCELCEVSLVAVPSNSGAIRLYNSQMQELSTSDVVALCAQASELDQLNKKDDMDKNAPKSSVKLSEAALSALGLTQEASSESVSLAIVELQQNYNAINLALQQQKDSAALSLVESAISEGKITAEEKETFITLAKSNLSLAETALSRIPAKRNLSQSVSNNATEGSSGRDSWTYKDWAKNDPQGLTQLKLNDNAKFLALQSKIK